MSQETTRDPSPDGRDPSEAQLSAEMLLFTTGVMMCATMLWIAIYWKMGHAHSLAIPLAFQFASVVTMGLYWRYRRLELFAMLQLGLILFAPFAMQWSIGNFVSASGVSLWGLLAPIGAVTILGTRNSIPWFVGWLFMTAMAGTFDFLLASDIDAQVAHGRGGLDMRAVSLFFVLNFTCISAMIYALLWYFAAEKDKLRRLVQATHEEVRREKERSERLLLNVLPPAIAERLKAGEANIAQGHGDVTVLFADIVGFTRMSEELAPAATVTLLNDIFSRFDELAVEHGVEKIKTIGDAYMAAAGLMHGSQLHTCHAVARLALEMVRIVEQYVPPSGHEVRIRVGIGTGPVVAGVIGKQKFIYDLWGDTVNVAFRMAAEAPPGSVQVDPVTHRRLQGRFDFAEPRELEIKGKGRMRVYVLGGPRERSLFIPTAPASPVGDGA